MATWYRFNKEWDERRTDRVFVNHPADSVDYVRDDIADAADAAGVGERLAERPEDLKVDKAGVVQPANVDAAQPTGDPIKPRAGRKGPTK